jgi:hypothetical protein
MKNLKTWIVGAFAGTIMLASTIAASGQAFMQGYSYPGSTPIGSIGLADDTNLFNVTGSPLTSAGILHLNTYKSQAAGSWFGNAGGSSGPPIFNTTAIPVGMGGTGATSLTGYLKGNGTGAFTAQTTPIPVGDGGTGATTLTGVVLGNGTSALTALTDTQLTTHINAFTSALSGAVPASGGGTTNFLRADGTWATAGSSTDIVHVSGTITSAQLKALHATPINIVAAQGANKAVIPVNATFKYVHGATAYTGTGATVTLNILNGQNQYATIISQTNMGNVLDTYEMPSCTILDHSGTLIENQPLSLYNPSTTELATGDGTLKYDIDYRVVTF